MNDADFLTSIGDRCKSKLSAQDTRFDAVPILGQEVAPPAPEARQVDTKTDLGDANSTNCHPMEPKEYQLVEVYGLFQQEPLQGERVNDRDLERQKYFTGYSPILTALYGGDGRLVLDFSCLVGDPVYVKASGEGSIDFPRMALIVFVAGLTILSM
jgi:hypothetical protein